MRLGRRGQLITGLILLFIVIAAGPMIHQIDLCDGKILVDGSFPDWSGDQGIGSAFHTTDGHVDVRLIGIHFGPFRWVVTVYYRGT